MASPIAVPSSGGSSTMPDLIEQAEQSLVVEGRRADAVGVAGEGHHADGIAAAAVHPGLAAGDELAEGRLDHLQAVARPVVEPQIDGAHAAGRVDDHRDRDPFAQDPGGLDAPLRPGERQHREAQDERAQPWQRGVQPGGERRPQPCELAARREAERARDGAAPQHHHEHGDQQQKQQRLRMREPHGAQDPLRGRSQGAAGPPLVSMAHLGSIPRRPARGAANLIPGSRGLPGSIEARDGR